MLLSLLIPFFIGFLYFAYRTIEDRRSWWFVHSFFGALLTLIISDVMLAVVSISEIIYLPEDNFVLLKVVMAMLVVFVLHELYRSVLNWMARRREQRQVTDGPLDKLD